MKDKKNLFKKLIQAITVNNINIYHKIINSFTKDDIDNLKDKQGNTLLHLAIINHNSIILEDLIKRKINLNITTKNGSTPLHLSIETFRESSIPIIENLLKHKININALNNIGRTALDSLILDNVITKDQKTQIVKLFLENHYNLMITKEHFTILHTCAAKGYFEIMELLINKIDVNISDDGKWTMLHLAIKNNHPKIVQLLLKYHADIKIPSPEGLNAIQSATKQCNLKIINSLLKYNDTEDHTCSEFLVNLAKTIIDQERGWTLLHIAAVENYTEIMNLLLKYDIDICCKDNMGQIPLHLAAERGHITIVKDYIAQNVGIQIQDACGKTPLHSAILGGNYTIISALLKQDCNMNTPDYHGITPQHLLTHTSDSIMHDIFRRYSNAQTEESTIMIVGDNFEAV